MGRNDEAVPSRSWTQGNQPHIIGISNAWILTTRETCADLLLRGSMRRTCLVGFLLCLIVLPLSPAASADETAALPEVLLLPAMPHELREVVEGATFVGEKKRVIFPGDKAVYEYLLNHLDFASQVARALNLSDYAIQQTGEGIYEATTPRGGWARLQVVYADRENRVVLARGRYGRAVVVLRYASFDRGGESYLANDLYGYVRADNPLLKLLLPLFGGLLDHRVAEIFSSVAELSERAFEVPTLLYQEILAHPELSSDHLLEFAEILKRVSKQEAQALLARPT